jgi:hypothetical protein
VGGYFGLSVISKNNDSNANGHCTSTGCYSTGKQFRLDAIDAGNLATIAFAAGGVLVAGGVVLYLLGGPSKVGDTRAAISAAPAIGPGTAGLRFLGRF